MSAPQWPGGLKPQTPLPFTLWEVMDAIDGTRDMAEVVRVCGRSEAEVRAALLEVTRWVTRATEREQPLSAAQQDALTNALISVVGPMARVMVEDALDDLEDAGQVSSMNGLLGRLAPELSDAQRAAFAAQLRARSLT